jgi:hypothetical protein
MRPFRRRLSVVEIKSATRLRVEPGDTIVLGAKSDLTNDEISWIKNAAEEALPGVKCIILTDDLELRSVRHQGAGAV